MSAQQRYYLDAMGVQVWERRDAPTTAHAADASSELASPAAVIPTAVVETPAAPLPTQSVPAVTVPSQQHDHDAIPAWLDEAPPPEPPLYDMEPEGYFDESDFLPASVVADDLATLDWPALQARVSECVRCPELAAHRKQVLFGAGNPQADWMIIGAVPDADEDQQGESFIAQDGVLLTAMLRALGLKRQQVYITNVLKCAAPEHRDPEPREAEACAAFLQRQIALVQPRIILLAGRVAAQTLLKVQTPVSKLRGTVHHYEGGIPMVVTYHPAYLLRSPLEKRQAWADLSLAMSVLEAGE
jgi:DNA polymerase